jgi:hypothetical protein
VTPQKGLTAEEMAQATGLSVDEVLMLGRPPYALLVPHPTSRRYRLSQVSWARKLLELRSQAKTWLEIRAWAAKVQKKDWNAPRED